MTFANLIGGLTQLSVGGATSLSESNSIHNNSTSSNNSSNPVDRLDDNFRCYLRDAHLRVRSKVDATACWQYEYDGVHPPPDSLISSSASKRSNAEALSRSLGSNVEPVGGPEGNKLHDLSSDSLPEPSPMNSTAITVPGGGSTNGSEPSSGYTSLQVRRLDLFMLAKYG